MYILVNSDNLFEHCITYWNSLTYQAIDKKEFQPQTVLITVRRVQGREKKRSSLDL